MPERPVAKAEHTGNHSKVRRAGLCAGTQICLDVFCLPSGRISTLTVGETY